MKAPARCPLPWPCKTGRFYLAGVGKSHKYALGLGRCWLPRCGDLNKIKHNFITRGRPCGELRIHLQAGSPSRPVILIVPPPPPAVRASLSSAREVTARRPLTVQLSAPVSLSIPLRLLAESLLCPSTPAPTPGLPAGDGKAPASRPGANWLSLLLCDFSCPTVPVVP